MRIWQGCMSCIGTRALLVAHSKPPPPFTITPCLPYPLHPLQESWYTKRWQYYYQVLVAWLSRSHHLRYHILLLIVDIECTATSPSTTLTSRPHMISGPTVWCATFNTLPTYNSSAYSHYTYYYHQSRRVVAALFVALQQLELIVYIVPRILVYSSADSSVAS